MIPQTYKKKVKKKNKSSKRIPYTKTKIEELIQHIKKISTKNKKIKNAHSQGPRIGPCNFQTYKMVLM